jgi:DNA-binding LacI/PurR family transcriptional regulator
VGRLTLQTIADELGVSRTTVSNAFSRPDQLSDELRARIVEVADRLGYAGPDPLARSLRGGRVGAVGVLVTGTLRYALQDPYTAELLSGIADAVGAEDTGLLLVPLPPQQPPAPVIRRAVVDGFVVFNLPAGHPAVEAAATRGLPMVTVDGPRLPNVPFVRIDERAAARELTGRVLAHGHRRLLVLTFRVCDDDHTGRVDATRLGQATHHVTRERLAGVLAATRAGGLGDAEVVIQEVGEHRMDLAVAGTLAALRRPDPPTAVIALSDRLALGVMEALEANGIAVPGDVSITGYDDIAAAARAGLTTIHQPAVDKGRLAGQIVTGAAAASEGLLPYGFVTRESVAAPGRSAVTLDEPAPPAEPALPAEPAPPAPAATLHRTRRRAGGRDRR